MFGIRVNLLLFIYLFYLTFHADCNNIRHIFCADSACSEPISEAQGKLVYSPPEKNVLGFNKGAKVLILGKSKDKDGYWLGKIGNNVGYVPSSHLKEIKVWKTSDMLKYEVPLTIENNKISVKVHENYNLGQENAGTDPFQDTDFNALNMKLNGSASIPLTNLIHGDISTISSEPLQEQVKNEPKVPEVVEVSDPNVEPTGTNSDNDQTKLPLNVINQISNNVNQNDEQKPNEKLNFAEEPLNHVFNSANNVNENSEDLTVLKSSLPEQLKLEKSDVITNSNTNFGSNVNSEEDPMDAAETRRVDYATSDEKLSNVQNVNEKLEENMRGNVVGSKDIYNSAGNLKEISTSSSTLMVNSDLVNISITSTVSSSSSSSDNTSYSSNSSSSAGNSFISSDDSTQKSSLSDTSNNLENSDLINKNNFNEKKLDYTLVSQIYETTALPVEDTKSKFNMSEIKNENLNLSQNILPNSNTLNEGSIVQKSILSSPIQNANQENTITSSERTVDSVNDYTDTPESSSIDGTSTNEGSSSISSSTSSISITTSIAASNSYMNDEKTVGNNPKLSDVTVDLLSKESTATYQDPEQVRKETYIPDATDGINAWVAQFGHTPAIEIMEESIHSFSINTESLTVQASDRQSGILNIQTPSTDQPMVSKTVDIIEPTTSMSHQEDKIEKSEIVVPVEGTTENLSYEVPVQQFTSPADDVVQNTEENISEDVFTEPSVPVPDHVDNPVDNPTQESPLENNISSAGIGDIGFFSKTISSFLSWVGLGDKTTEDKTETETYENINEELVEDKSTDKLSQESTATIEGSCKSKYDLDSNCEDTPLEESKTQFWNIWMDSKDLEFSSSHKTLMYLVVTAVTVLLFTLGYYFIEKFQTDGPLIAKVNKLEQELLVSSKECIILKDELANTKEKLNLFETSSNDKIITALQLELEESKKVRSVLENNIEVLQQELDAATEAGLDLNRMLSEVLTQSGGSETLMKSVEHLQSQLNNQQKIIDEMTTKLIDKTKENQELQDELSAASEKIHGLESEIEDMRRNLNVHLKDNEDIIRDLTSKNKELQVKIKNLNETKGKELLKLQKVVADLENNVKSVSDSLNIKVTECNNLKDSIKKIKMKDNKNIDSLFEVSRFKAELTQSTSENTSLKERLKVEEDKVVKLEDKVKVLDEEIQELKQKSAEAQKEKSEAQTRLEVLSNYFKEKETQLQKELGLKEAMWVQKQGDDSTIYERIKSLEEEINSYKSQNETLKKEILDQERSLKAQITAIEKKAHDNWIAARQAERKLEESKQEGAQLRNKLTLLEKNMGNDLETSQHHRTGEEVNGGDSLSPLIHDTSSPLLFPPPLQLDPNNTALLRPGFIPPPMFMPPPPGGFMPPPPPFLPGDHRPPPLGRMSSPPLNNRFSPPPPEYAYDRISTPPTSPSSRNYRSPNESDRERFRHRTPTSPSFRSRNWQESPTTGMSGFRPITSERDPRREHKGGSNLSSGHSSDSLDKSSRHSSRV